MIPGSAAAQFFAAGASAGGGGGAYEISRSLRFNSADSAYLNRTPASAGNRKTWTWAGWVKRSAISSGSYMDLFTALTGANDFTEIRYHFNVNDDALILSHVVGGVGYYVYSSNVFRDPSSWYHIVVAVDTTQATSANRVKIYVNGVQVTQNTSGGYPAQNSDTSINATAEHRHGSINTYGRYFSGYLADIHFIDGQALDPTSFGEFDTNGVWQPKAYSGTYGTNGFHLPFSDNSTAAALGTDTSGSGNDWTVNNISVGQTGIRQKYWASTTTNPGIPYPADNPPAYAFNGASASLYAAFTGTWAMNWGSLPTPISPSSTFRVYLYPRLGNITITINGTNTYGPYSGDSKRWESLGFTGTINTISITGTDAAYWGISAFESDGSILTDPIAEGVIDSLVDTPTNYGTDTGAGGEVRGNYATLNPLDRSSNISLVNGNLDSSTVTSAWSMVRGTLGNTTGKWYFEYTMSNVGWTEIGIGPSTSPLDTTSPGSSTSYIINSTNGYKGNSGNYEPYGSSFTTGDIIGIAYDLDNGKVWWAKNGTWVSSGDPAAGTNAGFTGIASATYFPILAQHAGGGAVSGSLNAGSRPFAYTAPSGFKALCTTNLPEPTIADGSTAMDVKLWTGNGSTQTISGLGFSPDLVWIKSRSIAASHVLCDAVRGATKQLFSNLTAAEATEATSLTAFNSDGFSLGSYANVNESAATFVGWTWDAGSSTVTNNDGSIESQVRANPSAGFSIVTYTGNNTSGATVGHGLNAKPSLIICKRRENVAAGASYWQTYHTSLGATKTVWLNLTDAAYTTSTAWNDTEPLSTVFTLGSDPPGNPNGDDVVAYCFAPVAGYSSFGSYTGNGSADGPFVFTGMRPRFLLVKNTTGANNWCIIDSARNTYNIMGQRLFPNLSNAEDTQEAIDFLSNGFKVRNASSSVFNQSANVYIYAAFAESPFQYARAR